MNLKEKVQVHKQRINEPIKSEELDDLEFKEFVANGGLE